MPAGSAAKLVLRTDTLCVPLMRDNTETYQLYLLAPAEQYCCFS